jgi:hypothetical protein
VGPEVDHVTERELRPIARPISGGRSRGECGRERAGGMAKNKVNCA